MRPRGEYGGRLKALLNFVKLLGGVGREPQRGLTPEELYGQMGSITVFMPALLPKRGVTRIPGDRLYLDW